MRRAIKVKGREVRGVTQVANGVGSRARRAREGYQAMKPAGTTVSSPASNRRPTPSSGKVRSCFIKRQDELLISSAARGAQNAMLPMANEKASKIRHEAKKFRRSAA